jgi:methyl-accepting chemotaxis protein
LAILEAVRENSILMQGVSVTTRGQASAIEEVRTAIRRMDEMAQHNAALVEEINAAMEQTESQASELDQLVDMFTLDGHDQGSAPARHAEAAWPGGSYQRGAAPQWRLAFSFAGGPTGQ